MRPPNRFAISGGILCGVILLGAFEVSLLQAPVRQGTQANNPNQGAQANTATQVMRASNMIGRTAQLKTGAQIGTVKDLVLGNEATVDFVLVAFHEELVLVPFNLCEVDEANQVVLIDVALEQLREFHRIHDLAEVRAVSRLFIIPINLRGGGTLGSISDLVFTNAGQVEFLAIGFEQKLIPVPFSLARFDFMRQFVAIDVTREQLLRAFAFPRNQFPNLSGNSQVTQQINTFFRTETGGRGQPFEKQPPTARPQENRPMDTRPMEKTMPGTRPQEKGVPGTQPTRPMPRPPEKTVPGTRPTQPMPRPAARPTPKTPPPQKKGQSGDESGESN